MIINKLKELRLTNNYKQLFVANYLNISQNTYSQYETGRRSIPLDLLLKLSKLYNCSIDYLLSD